MNSAPFRSNYLPLPSGFILHGVSYSRRDLTLLLPALAAVTAAAQDKSLPSKVYKFEDLTLKGHSRAVLNGETKTGCPIEMHETEVAPGQMPHAPHHHVHEELMMLREGTLEVTISENVTTIGPGSAVFIKSGEQHGWKNTGSTPAHYFVIALGRD
jgi:quercetin dioxygenase-like cupin family protein